MKCVAYTRGTPGVRGSAESIGFWRRIRLPLAQLRDQGLFTSFDVHDLGMEDHLTEGMLIGPDVVVLHNFFPREPEITLMEKLSMRLIASGRIPCWVYDFDIPSLLEEEEVFRILPLMRLITVPNIYLQEEVDTLSRMTFQHVEITHSTFSMFVFAEAQRKVQRDAQDLFTLGCLGPHAWDRLLPDLFEALRARLSPDQFAGIRIVTDSIEVARRSIIHGVGNSLIVKSGLEVSTYPQLLAQCHVGLLPREGKDREDTCWLWEYGAMNIPCLAALGSSYDTPESGKNGMTLLQLSQPEEWARVIAEWIGSQAGHEAYKYLAHQAYQSAIDHRVALIAPLYARIYQEILPISPRGH